MRNKNTINISPVCYSCREAATEVGGSREIVASLKLFACFLSLSVSLSRSDAHGRPTTTLVGIIKAAFHGHYFLVTAVSMLLGICSTKTGSSVPTARRGGRMLCKEPVSGVSAVCDIITMLYASSSTH